MQMQDRQEYVIWDLKEISSVRNTVKIQRTQMHIHQRLDPAKITATASLCLDCDIRRQCSV